MDDKAMLAGLGRVLTTMVNDDRSERDSKERARLTERIGIISNIQAALMDRLGIPTP